MGYYTRFELEVIGQEDFSIDHEKEITLNTDYAEWNSCFEGEIKWYDHTDDMIDYSLKYPNLIFKLMGRGEEEDDIWVKYFKNGKFQYCRAKITFDEYDETKLE